MRRCREKEAAVSHGLSRPYPIKVYFNPEFDNYVVKWNNGNTLMEFETGQEFSRDEVRRALNRVKNRGDLVKKSEEWRKRRIKVEKEERRAAAEVGGDIFRREILPYLDAGDPIIVRGKPVKGKGRYSVS